MTTQRAPKVSQLALQTLKLTIEEGVRPSYFPELKQCVAAGLVVFGDLGRGAPFLTEAGREALAAL